MMLMFVPKPSDAHQQTTIQGKIKTYGPKRLLQQVTESTETAITSTSGTLEAMIDNGLGFLGIRYRRGGNGPESGGFDCSGLVKRVFGSSMGIDLPRSAGEMAKVGDEIPAHELIPGDLVFFNTMNRAFSHVGIYLGNNKFLHSPTTGGVVRIEKMDINYWRQRFNGGRRLVTSDEG